MPWYRLAFGPHVIADLVALDTLPIRQAAERLSTTVTQRHSAPFTTDPISDARLIIAHLSTHTSERIKKGRKSFIIALGWHQTIRRDPDTPAVIRLTQNLLERGIIGSMTPRAHHRVPLLNSRVEH